MAKKKIIWSNDAYADLIAIFSYWQSVIGNNKYCRKIKRNIDNNLKYYSLYSESGKPTIRQDIKYFNFRYYIIYYKILPERIEVMRIWDGRQNPGKSPFSSI
jgi:plasmid stabilization system protein ParE